MKMKVLIFSSFCLAGAAMAAPADLPPNSSSGIIALNSLPNPSTTLATASVADAKGTVVGAVQKIVLDTRGKPTTVDVALMGSNAVVAIDASKFNYDQGHTVLTAQLDAREIAAAPPAS
ncbi:MAG TPA: hypothetical protein VG798_03185 [Rhizomicrobium sp.]|nr:hypothetical protein [Rhizomicrobium sp.]